MSEIMNDTKSRLLNKIRIELGKHITDALEDDTVIEIMLNPDGSLWIDRLGKGMSMIERKTTISAQSAIHTIASYIGTSVDKTNPILECELPLCGSRFEGLIPPIVPSPSFTIRKKAKVVFTLEHYLQQNIITSQQKEKIENAIHERKNILIAGGTGSGKTTLTNAIIAKMSELTPDDRIVIIEDTAEIQCTSENHAIFRSNDSVDMTRLLKVTMRYRPDRILVGEVRGGEALMLLKSWNTGHPGGIATVHANSAYSALTRLSQLVAEVTASKSETIIAEAVNMVIFITKKNHGRIVDEIIEVIDYDQLTQKYNTRNI